MAEIFGLRENQRAVLVASTGGHLQQLHRLRELLPVAADPLWITFENEQSKSLLAEDRISFVSYIASRDTLGALRAIPRVARLLRRERFDVVVSTGSAIAAVALPLARLMGKEAVYVESVARFDGPSLTGRMLAYVPGVRLYTQHRSWSNRRWTYDASVLSQYGVLSTKKSRVTRIFVTLGTIKPFRFDRLVDRILQVVPDTCDVVWQVGSTTREDLPGEVLGAVSVGEFDKLVAESDVVITHAGVGSALRILDSGKCPVMVPRRACVNEHVDDHQTQISQRLGEIGLAVAVEASDLTFSDLERASAIRVVRQ